MTEVQKTRLSRLKKILHDRFAGDIPALARALNKSDDHVRKMLKPESPGGRYIGEKLARDIERRLTLQQGWLDGLLILAGETASKSSYTASQIMIQEAVATYGANIDEVEAASLAQLIKKLGQ